MSTVATEPKKELWNMNPKDMTMEDAIELGKKIVFVEAGLKGLKDKMKLFVEINGPVEVDDIVWDKYPSCSWSFTPENKKEFATMIAIEGLNPWDYLSLSSSDLKKLGWSEAVLSQYAAVKTNYTFKSKKKDSK